MEEKLLFTETDVRNIATSNSFARGRSLFREEAIFNTRREGNTLYGHCEGNYAPFYNVQVVTNEKGLAYGVCSCPYEGGGECKHVVALCLAYLDKPESFAESKPVQNTLESRSKEQLISLIETIVKHYPQVRDLIERPTPETVSSGETVDVSSIRRQFARAEHTLYDWGDPTLPGIIDSVLEAGDQFLQTGDYRNARTIYRVFLEEAPTDYYRDDLHMAVSSGMFHLIESLNECMGRRDVAETEQERRETLDLLFDVLCANLDYDLGWEAQDAILQHVRPADIPHLRERLQAKRQELNLPHLLQDFEYELDLLDNVDPEVMLNRLREAGSHGLLFSKLLDLERHDEAVALVKEHFLEGYAAMQYIIRLEAAGLGEQVQQMVEEKLQETFNPRLSEWLLEHYRDNNNDEGRLRLLRQHMLHSPEMGYYKELKRLAKKLGQWATIHQEIIDHLQKKDDQPTLVRVHLRDKNWDAAWETLETLQQKAKQPSRGVYGTYYPLRELELEVAERMRAAQPHRAIALYVKNARRSIDDRGRSNYQAAATLLANVKAILESVDQQAAWETLISEIRTEFKQLPALKDELNKAGL
jgi:hypothetical protein